MKKSWDLNWNKFYKSTKGNQYPEPSIIRFIAENYYQVKDRSHIKILELGYGTGGHQWYFNREGFDTYGIDISSRAINMAKARLKKEGLQSHLCVRDFISLPYKDESMDAVIDTTSIQHNSLEAIREIIKEIYRVLKKGGKFFGMLIAEHKDLSDSRFKTHFFKKKEIRALFSKFKNVKIDNLHYSEENGEKYIKFWIVETQKLQTENYL